MHAQPLPNNKDGATKSETNKGTISFFEAFCFWLKLGFISFGGPAGQIAIMHQELVERRHWLSERRFLHALNYCMVLPGPEAQQLATYIGWLTHKTGGGIVAGALFVLPSFFILVGLSWLYMAFGHTTFLAGLFYGIKPAVTAIVLQAAYRIGSKALKNTILWGIALAAFIAIFIGGIPFPIIIVCSALVGVIGGRYFPQYFQLGGGHKPQNIQANSVYMIDDNASPLPYTLFTWTRLTKVLVIGLGLWCLPMFGLIAYFGWPHILSQMAWFFSKAALLTFGGAYAVLPYVYQGAVDHFAWLNASQMMDGLALGETTPGPLIMVVTYVGFVGGYLHPYLGSASNFLSGFIAAAVVTWFTFLPSFIFILAGGPIVESTHNVLKFTAPLTAITAAVVGVILNLGLFFGYHVIWPAGVTSGIQGIDWTSLLITVFAAFLLFKLKWSVMRVIIIAAVIGLGIQLIQ